MKFNEIQTEEKVRLDPKCWTGKKIGNPKTKMKGGVRVNNCVPAESVEEDLSRRGFLKGVGAAAFAGPAIGANAQTPADLEIEFAYRLALAKKQGKAGKPFNVPKFSPNGSIADLKIEHAYKLARAEAGFPPSKSSTKESVEDFNPEYDDEAGMADNNLSTLRRAVDGLDDLIDTGDNLPEWCQEKIAVAKSMLVAVWDYMESADDAEEEDPEIEEMYEAMESLAEEMSHKNKVSIDLVWESFESLDDHELYETAAWRRKEGKSKSGGLNAKGVASYRRENPGSKLQTAVTTKPSKLKPGSKAAKRRKSFCARMSGVKGPMKKPNGKPTRKALALRKWNC